MTEEPQRKRRRRASPFGEMRDAARSQYLTQGSTPAELEEWLQREFPDADARPERRTIESWVHQVRVDNTARWTLTPETAADAALVLDSLRAYALKSTGRVHAFSVETTRWVIAVRRAAPDLDALQAYHVAVRYQQFVAAGESTEILDLYLAFAPWRGTESKTRYEEAVASGRVPELKPWVVGITVTSRPVPA